MTIQELKHLRESEDPVEFKEAKGGNYSYSGGSKLTPKDRRHCILGYVSAFANEGGGYLVFGMKDKHPHEVSGTYQAVDGIGKLSQDIYNDLKIRVDVSELFEDGLRVVVIKVPGRPAGKVYKFEDVPLMRVGEELLPMSDERYLRIIQEQEPDFSEQICSGATIHDLDDNAVAKLKETYARKQHNPRFLTLSNQQALSDVGLINSGKVSNAAIILVGKSEAIRRFIPQATINLEYRNSIGQITFDNRYQFQEPYFISLEKIWETINLRNGNVPVQQGPFIFDIPYFNIEVIREALNNAVAHRDYKRTSEVIIKQYPNQLNIINPGGFPIGVNLDNLLTVNSTPRNRLLADVLAKTGIVERSGQGIDKIFYQSVSEAKPEPDFSFSDDFQVELRLSAIVQDKAFAIFINEVQKSRESDNKLGVKEIIALGRIRRGIDKNAIEPELANKLIREGLVEKVGKTTAQRLILSKTYYSFTDTQGKYTLENIQDPHHAQTFILKHFSEFKEAQMKDFVQLLETYFTREQIKNCVYNLVKRGILEKSGNGRSTLYTVSQKTKEDQKILGEALKIGFQELMKQGVIPEKER